MLSNPASSTVFDSSTSWSTGHIGTAHVYCIRVISIGSSRERSSRLVRPYDPHRVVLRAAAVGVAEGLAGIGHLVLARLAHHLDRRLGEPDHARCANGVRRQHAAGRVERDTATDRRLAGFGELPALALRSET